MAKSTTITADEWMAEIERVTETEKMSPVHEPWVDGWFTRNDIVAKRECRYGAARRIARKLREGDSVETRYVRERGFDGRLYRAEAMRMK